MVLLHKHINHPLSTTGSNSNLIEVLKKIPNSLMGNGEELGPKDLAKKAAAFACADAHVKSGMCLGVGSGSTIKYLILWLKQQCEQGNLSEIRCTRQWLHEAGLPIDSLETLNSLDLTIDGADEIDEQLTCIKGGGGCLLQEKVVQSCAETFILIGDLEKYTSHLGATQKSVPVEVVPYAWAPVKRWITEKLGGECVLRMDQRKCFPSVTENHNYIFDWHFPDPGTGKQDWAKVHENLINITGVVETGLFINVAKQAYLGKPDGSVKMILPK